MADNKHIEDLKKFIPEPAHEEAVQTNITSCRDCVFSVKNENGRQTACKLGRIEKFRKKGINVIEAYNGEDEFYGIETWCNAYRTEAWELAHKGEDLLDVAKGETIPNVNFIILVKESMDNIEKTTNSVLNQTYKAGRIVVVHTGKESDVDYLELIHKCNDLLGNKIGYKVQNVMPDTPQEESIDETFTNLVNGYYTVLSKTV